LDTSTTIAAILTLMGYTYLYKENPLSRFAEHTLVAATAAYTASIGYANVVKLAITPISAGNWVLIIPIILGLCLYLRYMKETFFISRWPLALIIATGIGINIRSRTEADILAQVRATMISLAGSDPYTNFINILIMIMVILTITYFVFTIRAKAWETPAKIGRYCAMIFLGAMYGNTLASRVNILIGRLMFILLEWLGLG